MWEGERTILFHASAVAYAPEAVIFFATVHASDARPCAGNGRIKCSADSKSIGVTRGRAAVLGRGSASKERWADPAMREKIIAGMRATKTRRSKQDTAEC